MKMMSIKSLIETLLFSIVSFLVSYIKSDPSVIDIDSTHEYVSQKYLDTYAIPSSYFTATPTSGNSMENVFDRNWGTQYENKVSNFEFVAVFNSEVNIDKIAYQCNKDYLGYGYPTSLELKFMNSTDDDWSKTIVINSDFRGNIVIFDLGETVTCKKLKWYVKTMRFYYFYAQEIIFYQPKSDIKEDFYNLFQDYNYITLNPKYNTNATLTAFESELSKEINYETTYKDTIERAKKVISGEVFFYAARQFHTLESSYPGIKLKQKGNLRSYGLNTLKMVWYGLNIEMTGISCFAGEKLTIYTDFGSNTKIPNIKITQNVGHYSNWENQYFFSNRYKTEITCPSFNLVENNPVVPLGGPIYIENPYTPEEQTDPIKIYIEGGKFHPHFRKGGNEAEFKKYLEEYCALMKYYPDQYHDLMETESVRFVFTLSATMGKKYYLSETDPKSVQKNLENWDTWVIKLLKFDGVTFDTQNPHYDYKNEWININIRNAQPFAAAYAHNDHVGILKGGGWEVGATYTEYWGWGFAHEVAHTLDINERLVSECTNNMISKYEETAVSKLATRGSFDELHKRLNPDPGDSTYWNADKSNFLIWWMIEQYHIGYWGELDNMYRYTTLSSTISASISATEKQVYFTSLIIKLNMSYYFERWGYALKTTDSVFTYESSSDTFKELMTNATRDGKFDNSDQPKIWYFDQKEWTLKNSGLNLQIYNENMEFQVENIRKYKNDAGKYKYDLLLPVASDTTGAHLGFEVLEGADENNLKVVGFSYLQQFTDPNEYDEDYTPTYTIRAYDRSLHHSGKKKVEIVLEDTVRIKDTKYNTLSEAISSLLGSETNEEDYTIYLLKENYLEGGITIQNMKVIIKLDDTITSAKITRACDGTIFYLTSGGSLSIEGNIILDGGDFNSDSAVITIKTFGKIYLNGATIQNGNRYTGNLNHMGGAIYLSSSNWDSKIDATNTKFINCSCTHGGAIGIETQLESITFTDCLFKDNYASDTGGAIYVTNYGGFTMERCKFINNSAVVGGAIGYCNRGTTWSNLLNSEFYYNSATKGGAIFINGGLTSKNITVKYNTALNGSGIYVATGTGNTASSLQYSIVEDNILQSGGYGSKIYITHTVNSEYLIEEQTTSTALCSTSDETIYVVQGKVIVSNANYYGCKWQFEQTAGLTYDDSDGIKYTGTNVYVWFKKYNSNNVDCKKDYSVNQIIEVTNGETVKNVAVSSDQTYIDLSTILGITEKVACTDQDGNQYPLNNVPTKGVTKITVNNSVKFYKVTVYYNSSSDDANPSIFYVKEGDNFTLGSSFKSGKYAELDKWVINNIEYEPNKNVTITNDCIIKATFKCILDTATAEFPPTEAATEAPTEKTKEPDKEDTNIIIPNDNTTDNDDETSEEESSSSGSNVGVIAGCTTGGVAAIGIGSVAFYFLRKNGFSFGKKKPNDNGQNNNNNNDINPQDNQKPDNNEQSKFDAQSKRELNPDTIEVHNMVKQKNIKNLVH